MKGTIVAFVCNAVWTAKRGSEEVVRDALVQLSRASRAEPGNFYYQVFFDPDAPRVFRIFEVYRDADAFAAHAESEHFARHGLATAIPELESREREFYETLDD